MDNFFSGKTGNSAISAEIAEIDELYHFVNKKEKTKTKENMYVIAIASREPRQIVGIIAVPKRKPKIIEKLVRDSPHAKQYYSDGLLMYKDVTYPGNFKQNTASKDDTFTIESVNADLRTYIPTLARRSRCFPRKDENLNAVLILFAYAYNLFGQWKQQHCKIPVVHKSTSSSKGLRKFRYPKKSIIHFLFA